MSDSTPPTTPQPAEQLPAKPVPRAMDLVNFDPTSGIVKFWCSWSTEDEAGQVRAQNCLAGEDERLEEFIGKEISVVNVIAHPAQTVDDESGEVVQLIRMVLIDPTGCRIACSSTPAFRCVASAISFAGNPPWEPPVRFKVVQKSSKRDAKRRMFLLEMLPRKVTQVKPGKEK